MTKKPALQAEGKGGSNPLGRMHGSAFDAGVTRMAPPTRKQLTDCRAVVFSADADQTACFWDEKIRNELICRKVDSVITGTHPVTLPEGFKATEADIAIFMFYRGNVEPAVLAAAYDLRQQNPNIYVVVVSATPENVNKREIDLVVDKTNFTKESLTHDLINMLCIDPIGSRL